MTVIITTNLSHNVSNILFVLDSEIRSDLHQDWKFLFSLKGVPLPQHLSRSLLMVSTSGEAAEMAVKQ